jgi:hypothetical protein
LSRELPEERLQWFGHVKRTDGTRIPTKALELTFEGSTHTRQPRKTCFGQVLEDIKKRTKKWQGI